MTRKVGIIKDKRYLWHKSLEDSKECPERLFHIYNQLKEWDFLDKLIEFSSKEIDDNDICSVHSGFYLKQILEFSSRENGYKYDKDTYLNQDTFFVAKLAAGGCRVLADAIMKNEIEKGFALVRPPGHHAETGRAMGFCILNNIALTAKYLLERYALNRILIIDFDVHHGNGVQEIFYDNPQILTVSIHQKDIFPFTGKGDETGEGIAEGYNINVPVPSHFGDAEYCYIFGNLVQRITEQYLPQIILVSAGYDGHINDPISKTEITDEGYKNIAKWLVYLADKYCNGKLLYVLEGGYNLQSLCSGIKASFEALLESQKHPPGFMFSQRAQKMIQLEIPDKLRSKWGLISQ